MKNTKLALLVILAHGDMYRQMATRCPIRNVEHTFIKGDKVFVVDQKRPAAGTLNTTIDLDPDKQYFNSIKSTYTDTTIEAVTGLLGAVAKQGLFGVQTSDDDDPKPASNKFEIAKTLESTVASEIFEIDATNFEQQITDFLELHLNSCRDCNSNCVIRDHKYLNGFPPSATEAAAAPDTDGTDENGDDDAAGSGTRGAQLVVPPAPTDDTSDDDAASLPFEPIVRVGNFK